MDDGTYRETPMQFLFGYDLFSDWALEHIAQKGAAWQSPGMQLLLLFVDIPHIAKVTERFTYACRNLFGPLCCPTAKADLKRNLTASFCPNGL